MARYEFELAEASDDAALRALLHRIEMPGRISLKTLRDPSFFDGNDLSPGLNQTIVCRDTTDGSLVGFGCRSVRDHHVAGEIRPLGYLHMLRSIERVRSGFLLARAFRFLAEVHGDGAASGYLTTIAVGNDRATSSLAAGRADLPAYRPLGIYHTFMIPARRRRRRATDFDITSMAEVGVDETVDFLAFQATRRQLFPRYTSADFGPAATTFRDLDPADVLVAVDRGRIVGTLGVWDQRRFRQTMVTGFSPAVRMARHLHNGSARIRGRIPLPPVGSVLAVACAAVPVVVPGRADVADGLIGRARERAGRWGIDALLIGAHEASEWCRPAAHGAAMRYDTAIYEVDWNGRESCIGADVPYLELGVL